MSLISPIGKLKRVNELIDTTDNNKAVEGDENDEPLPPFEQVNDLVKRRE